MGASFEEDSPSGIAVNALLIAARAMAELGEEGEDGAAGVMKVEPSGGSVDPSAERDGGLDGLTSSFTADHPPRDVPPHR